MDGESPTFSPLFLDVVSGGAYNDSRVEWVIFCFWGVRGEIGASGAGVGN